MSKKAPLTDRIVVTVTHYAGGATPQSCMEVEWQTTAEPCLPAPCLISPASRSPNRPTCRHRHPHNAA